MTQFQPDNADKTIPSPEAKQEIQDKREKMQVLKRNLKKAPLAKKAELKTEIKALVKELKMIAHPTTFCIENNFSK